MTPFTLSSLTDLTQDPADTIIDVRAPSEFAEDHLPGAINLPVLDDAERARVGTIYKQQSPFDARKIGAALVARSTARHLDATLSKHGGGWQPLVYCWRGGQRSGAFATILSQVGWRVRLLEGGYRSYRRIVADMLYDSALPHRLVVIDGGTGTAKTALLAQLAAQGAQVLDLEGLAAHRGSLFGQIDRPQPSQKMFESQLADRLARLDPQRTTFVEAESSKIGARLVPPTLWARMGDAPRVRIIAPLSARGDHLTTAYDDLTANREKVHEVIDRLRPYHPAELIEEWHAQTRAGSWHALATGLIRAHYDPRYAKSSARQAEPVLTLDLPDLQEPALAVAAEKLAVRFS